MALGEFELIDRFFSRPVRRAALGIGDDCALLAPAPGMQLAISSDMLVDGRHFLSTVAPERLGHKALAVNLSDLAAMGAVPRFALLSLSLPAADEAWLEGFASGFFALADEHGVDLVGGDTTRGPLNICIQAMGAVPSGKALRRDGARAGDDIWVSGTLGDAAAAVASRQGLLSLPAEVARACQARLDRPTPRIALGQALIGCASAAIDISDGLVADLGHICERSSAAGIVDYSALPCSAGLRPLRHDAAVARAIATGGDDYELCFTAPSRCRGQLEALAARIALPLSRVGRMEEGSGVIVRDERGQPMAFGKAGFDHFG